MASIEIVEALIALKGSVRDFGKASEETIQRYAEELVPHGKYAVFAIKAWPLEHDEWPTLSEIVGATQATIAAFRQQAATDAASSGDSPVKKFVAAVRRSQSGGDGYVTSFLTPGVNCRHSHNALASYSYGAERITRDFGELAKSLGVSIVYDPACDEMLTMHVQELRRTGRLKDDRGARR